MRTSAEIKTELDEARAAQSAALLSQSYSVDDGQGKQTVTRASLSEIRKLIRVLEVEYDNALADEGGADGIMYSDFRRY